MSIRLRTVNGTRVALCAAENPEESGDLYLDDADHHALAAKFLEDWKGNGLIPPLCRPLSVAEWAVAGLVVNAYPHGWIGPTIHDDTLLANAARALVGAWAREGRLRATDATKDAPAAPMEKRDLAREGTPESPPSDSERGTIINNLLVDRVLSLSRLLGIAQEAYCIRTCPKPEEYGHEALCEDMRAALMERARSPLHAPREDTQNDFDWATFAAPRKVGAEDPRGPCPNVEPCPEHPRSTIIREGDAQQGGTQ